MAEQIRGTVIEGEYSSTLIVGPPDRPEPPRVEDKRLTRAQVRKKWGITDDELQELMDMPGFPASMKRIPLGEWGLILVWSESLLDRFAADKRALAAQITRLLG